MSFLKFLYSKLFLKHLAMAVGAIAFFFITVFIVLSIYTSHGDAYSVPDLTGLTEEQAIEIILQKGFRYQITDSVHISDFLPGSIVEQLPKPNSKVKKNRTIHLTINAYAAERVQIPNLIDYSLRNAKVILESFGLKVGELIYAPSEYTNLVLGQHYQGKPIEPGTPVEKGSLIDLVIGQGLSRHRTNIPDLTGLNTEEATHRVQTSSLNLGAIMYDESVLNGEDSILAFVWKQNPISINGSRLRLGSSIDIWLSIDSTTILPDTALVSAPDTIQ